MKIKNVDIINYLNVLSQFGNTRLPQKISYAITRNTSILTQEYSIYEKELAKIFEKYEERFEKDEQGNIKYAENGMPSFKGDTPPEFNADITTLLGIEIDVNLFLIQSEAFDYDDPRYDSLTGNEMMLLQKIICRDE